MRPSFCKRFSPIATHNLCQCTSDLPSCDCEWIQIGSGAAPFSRTGMESYHSNRFRTKHYRIDWLPTLSYPESPHTLILFERLFSYLHVGNMDRMAKCKISHLIVSTRTLKRPRPMGQALHAQQTNQAVREPCKEGDTRTEDHPT